MDDLYRRKDVHVALYLGFPLLICSIHYVWGLLRPDLVPWLTNEFGFVEIATMVILASTIFISLGCIYRTWNQNCPTLKLVIWILLLGSIYFLGEEASWGQHILYKLGWQPPYHLVDNNMQHEITIHNHADPILRFVFGLLPKHALTLFALVGGIIVPMIRRFSTVSSTVITHWAWPTWPCIPTCFLILVVTFPRKVLQNTWGSSEFLSQIPTIFTVHPGELKEALIALFIFFYQYSLYLRRKRLNTL